MKRCHFSLVFAMNFNVSMNMHKLTVSHFLLFVASTSLMFFQCHFFKVSDVLVVSHESALFTIFFFFSLLSFLFMLA